MTSATPLPADERGSASVMVALFLLGLLAAAGLVADGGRALAERRSLQNLADSAAAAGAMQLDVASYRLRGTARLDARAARSAAHARLAGAPGASYRVSATRDRVSVRVERGVRLTFLSLVGIRALTLGASAEAEPRAGVGTAP